jgi:nucleoside-diphosphate-sugar epimerase
MSALHVVVGAGPLGRAVSAELVRCGHPVRLVSRRGTARVEGAASVVADVLSDTGYAKGATVIYQCAQPPYDRWLREFPALQRAILDAAIMHGSSLVIADNLYAYGAPRGGIVDSSSPTSPATRKGVLRKRMAEEALAAHSDGRVQVALSRPSNYFGPGYDAFGRTVFERALRGKSIQLLGRADVEHSFSYVPDAGRAMAVLGTSDQSWGRSWITPVQRPVTQREFAASVWRASGHSGDPQLTVLGKRGMALLGLVVPTFRELVEMAYEFDERFVVDATEFEMTFGVTATPFEEAIAATVASYRARQIAA